MHIVGLDSSAGFDHVNHTQKALMFKLQQAGVGDPFLSNLTKFLSNRLQTVVDGQFNEYRHFILGVPQRSALSPLLFISYTYDM